MPDIYPFEFLGPDYSKADEWMRYSLNYKFVSEKSNHSYIVRIESYVHDLYCVKFYDEGSDRYGRFSQRSGTYEPRRIFRTVAAIALDVLKRNSSASFFFIGAADEKDRRGVSTRRYVVYSQFVKNTTLIPPFFEHFEVEYQSMYVLLNRNAVPDLQEFMQMILAYADIDRFQ